MVVIIINVGNAYSNKCLSIPGSILEALYMLSRLFIAHTTIKKVLLLFPFNRWVVRPKMFVKTENTRLTSSRCSIQTLIIWPWTSDS